jgi:hypothetical protein
MVRRNGMPPRPQPPRGLPSKQVGQTRARRQLPWCRRAPNRRRRPAAGHRHVALALLVLFAPGAVTTASARRRLRAALPPRRQATSPSIAQTGCPFAQRSASLPGHPSRPAAPQDCSSKRTSTTSSATLIPCSPLKAWSNHATDFETRSNSAPNRSSRTRGFLEAKR